MTTEHDQTAAPAVAPVEEHPLVAIVHEHLPAVALTVGSFRDQDWIVVPAEDLVAVCTVLRDDLRSRFDMLLDITAVDLLPRSPRFEVVYHLLSMSRNDRARLKVELPDGDAPAISTVTTVWVAAGFYEREIYDLMGIGFDGHPNMRRIMLPDDWVGHPLRFDHTLGGEEVSFTS
jgi:NADH-quinone oxidoreductase subunit C